MGKGKGKKIRFITKGKMIWLGFGLGFIFWILESCIHIIIFHHKSSLIYEILRPDPHETWMRSLIVVFFTFFGVFSQLVINRRKQTELALQKGHEDLKNSYKKLQQTQLQLIQSERLASIGKMAGAVAHEVNNPLEAIKSRVQLLQEELSERGNNNEFINDLNVIDEQVNRVANITKNLLEFSRIKIKRRSRDDINHILKNVINLEKYGLKSAGIKMNYNFDNKIPETLIDTEGIQQVFLNIIRNSKDAMDDGGELKITTLFKEREKVIINFKDTGMGIDSKDKRKIFDPFFTTKPDGTGLGLSICQSIIQQHNGSIKIDSFPGEGTEVKIELPIIEK